MKIGVGFNRNIGDLIVIRSIEEFVVVSNRAGRNLPELEARGSGKLFLFGQPLHETPTELMKLYSAMSLESFQHFEARNSIGNYVIFDDRADAGIIITSLGYSGGYIGYGEDELTFTTLLSDALSYQKGEFYIDEFGLSYLLSKSTGSAANLLPFTTMFKNIHRLPPSSTVKFSGGKVTKLASYLVAPDAAKPPVSLSVAFDEISSKLGNYYSNPKLSGGVKPAISFSGGADSLIIYLSLREFMDPKDIRVFTMHHTQHSITNGPLRAVPIAKSLDFDVELFLDDYLISEAAADFSEQLMRKDMVNARSPIMGLVEKPIEHADILHGQNMDTIINLSMKNTLGSLDHGVFWPGMDQMPGGESHVLNQYRAFVENLQYTDMFLEDKDFQKRIAEYLKTPITTVDPDHGGDGIYRGMISCQQPNILVKNQFFKNQLPFLDAEVARFKSLVGEVGITGRYGIDLIRHYSWSHIQSKRITTFKLPGDSRVVLPAMAGPLSSYYMGRTRDLSVAAYPKGELYDVIRKKSNKDLSYRQMFEGKLDRGMWTKEIVRRDFLLEKHSHRLKFESSMIRRGIESNPMRVWIKNIFAKANSSWQPGTENYQPYNQSVARTLLNVELLMDEASKKREARTRLGDQPRDSALGNAA